MVGSVEIAGALLRRPPESILIFRALQIGDLFCSIPAVRALRNACPDSQIVLAGLPWSRFLRERFPRYFDEVGEFPGYPGLPEQEPRIAELPAFLTSMQKRRFELAIQMQGDGSIVNSLVPLFGARRNAGFHQEGGYCPDPELFIAYPDREHEIRRHLALMRHLGAEPGGERLEFPVLERDMEELAAIAGTRALPKKHYICIHPGARSRTRQWQVERFAAVADTLLDQGHIVVVTGSSEDVGTAANLERIVHGSLVNLAGRTSLGALAALIADARLVIANDTAVSHIAAALGVASVIVVTASEPHRWSPLDTRRHRVVFSETPCRPCGHSQCPVGQPCTSHVSVEAVMEEVANLLHPEACRAQ
jgi:ADP-heptose:LPS heptosyltransferase